MIRLAVRGGTIAWILVLLGCPAVYLLELQNESEAEIVVFYESGLESTIMPGESTRQSYQVGCIRIRKEGSTLEFTPAPVSEGAVSVGVFRSAIRGYVTQDGQLEIQGADNQRRRLRPGCDNSNGTNAEQE
ncbi:MAG: hypothetical protein AAGL69_12510 [Pseudomonadota bacterium]